MRTNWDLENEAHRYNLPLVGVFNKDQLPKGIREGFYIINLQDDLDSMGNDLMGSHWTVFIIEGRGVPPPFPGGQGGQSPPQAAYFDSFGFAPPVEVQNFLKPFLPYPYNTQVVQSMASTVCGDYVMLFMMFMHAHRKDMRNVRRRFQAFMALWDKDVKKNRERLLKYLSQIK